jgi:hypothetical protein
MDRGEIEVAAAVPGENLSSDRRLPTGDDRGTVPADQME